MGEPVTLRNASDCWVSSGAPNTAWPNTNRLWVQAGERYAYIYFGRPFPMGVNIINATLRMYNRDQHNGTNTLSARRISEGWVRTRTRWNNRPQVFGAASSAQHSNAPDRTEWAIDLTSEMQAVSDGVTWRGLRLETDAINPRAFYSSNGPADFRPTLEISWSDAPEAPEDLYPSGGRAVSVSHPVLRCNFTDVSGDTDIQRMHVQIGTGEDAVESGTFTWENTGDAQLVDAPELDLAETTYLGLNVNDVVWWRVRVQDGAGLWSLWSEAESFTRQAKSALTIDNPAVEPNNVVEDPTPPIAWTFAGVQTAYQVFILNAATGKVIWNSGKTTSTAVSESLPRGVLVRTDITYLARVRIWDNKVRENTPGDPVFVQASREFTYGYDPSTDPVQDLVATPNANYPWVTLTFTRASMPDAFSIVRDNRWVEQNIPPEDLFISGLDYSYVDKKASARQEHTWRVHAIINGRTSQNNPSVSATPKAVTACVCRQSGADPVLIFNPERDMEWLESSMAHEIIGDAPPVLITQSQGGYAGTVAGRIVTHAGVLARTFRDRMAEFKREQGRALTLYLVDEAFDAVLFNIQWAPIPIPDGSTEYSVSFDFYQADQPTWETT